jgi:hypothetical protein
MVERMPVWLNAGTYQAFHDRLVSGMLVSRSMTTAGALTELQGGVVGPKDQLQPTVGSGFNVLVGAGVACVPRTPDPGAHGAYLCWNDAQETLTLSAAPSGQSRIDTIVAHVYDSFGTGGSEDKWELEVVQGGASTSPQSTADSQITTALGDALWVRIADVTVSPTAITLLTDKRDFVAAPGAIHYYWSDTPQPDPVRGRLAYNVTTDTLYLGDGASFDQMMTKADWNTYFSAYRPAQVQLSSADDDLVINGFDDWKSVIARVDNGNPSNLIQLTRRSPTGSFKIAVSSWGRCESSGVHGHVSVLVKQGATDKDLPTTRKGPAFYNTTWIMSEGTYLVTGLAADSDHTFTVQFRKETGSSSTDDVFFRNTRLVVTPIL